jgi:hypothetical protein
MCNDRTSHLASLPTPELKEREREGSEGKDREEGWKTVIPIVTGIIYCST